MCSEYTHYPTAGPNQLIQSPFYNKVLNISCNLPNAVLKVKSRMVIWKQNCWEVYQLFTSPPQRQPPPREHMADRGLRFAATAQHHKRVSYCILLGWGKIQIQSLKHGFYQVHGFYCMYAFHTITKSKTCRSNHPKSGIILYHYKEHFPSKWFLILEYDSSTEQRQLKEQEKRQQ